MHMRRCNRRRRGPLAHASRFRKSPSRLSHFHRQEKAKKRKRKAVKFKSCSKCVVPTELKATQTANRTPFIRWKMEQTPPPALLSIYILPAPIDCSCTLCKKFPRNRVWKMVLHVLRIWLTQQRLTIEKERERGRSGGVARKAKKISWLTFDTKMESVWFVAYTFNTRICSSNRFCYCIYCFFLRPGAVVMRRRPGESRKRLVSFQSIDYNRSMSSNRGKDRDGWRLNTSWNHWRQTLFSSSSSNDLLILSWHIDDCHRRLAATSAIEQPIHHFYREFHLCWRAYNSAASTLSANNHFCCFHFVVRYCRAVDDNSIAYCCSFVRVKSIGKRFRNCLRPNVLWKTLCVCARARVWKISSAPSSSHTHTRTKELLFSRFPTNENKQ